MERTKTKRGFEIVNFNDANGVDCSLQQSSKIGRQEGALENPGSSFLWLGCNDANPMHLVLDDHPSWRPVEMPAEYIANTRMHLNPDQVRMLIANLQSWLDTGSFAGAEWPKVVVEENK
jgi:hypothetical protein